MNTILYDDELEAARQMVWQLYGAGADALIVQDMAYLTMDLPPIALHASTQCDIRTPEKAAWLARAGFSQLVLPREFTLDEIRAAREAAGVPVEVFVHGALCVSYSGDCQAGHVAMGRSANRGECPQMCRLPYRLTDADGRELAPERHYLSLRDLNLSERMAELVAAGASSFKIEGRLKDSRYVANVVAAYSRILDGIVAANPGQYARSSAGQSTCSFEPNLNKTFNRGYTQYFLNRRRPDLSMASLATPKWAGEEVGTIASVPDKRTGAFRAKLKASLANGDGLGYFDASGHFCGFRLNRIHGSTIYPASRLNGLAPGKTLYRNSDKVYNDLLDHASELCKRTIAVEISLQSLDPAHIIARITDERSYSAEIVAASGNDAAKSPQTDARRRTMSKLGDTIYRLEELHDGLAERFVAASTLSDIRRKLVEALDATAAAQYHRPKASARTLEAAAFESLPELTYHDNIANRAAESFYLSHGARIATKAIEISKPVGGTIVMTTRYCLRRELGACLRVPHQSSQLPRIIFLENPTGRYRVDCDCNACEMKIVKDIKLKNE